MKKTASGHAKDAKRTNRQGRKEKYFFLVTFSVFPLFLIPLDLRGRVGCGPHSHINVFTRLHIHPFTHLRIYPFTHLPIHASTHLRINPSS